MLNNDINFWDSDDDSNEEDDKDNDIDYDNEDNNISDNISGNNDNDNDTELSLHDFYDKYKIVENEENCETDENDENKYTFGEREIFLVMKQTNVSKEEAEQSLVNCRGDVLNAVLELKI